MSVTNYQANRILDREFGAAAYSTLPTLYIGLSTTAILDDGTGATEPSVGGYARVAVTNDKTNWGTASAGVLTNAVAIEFPIAMLSWGTITHAFVADAASAGNILYFQELDSSEVIFIGSIPTFAINGFTVTVTNT